MVGGLVPVRMWPAILGQYEENLRAAGATEGTVRLRLHHARRFARLGPREEITAEMLTAILARPGCAETRKSLRASARRLFGWMVEAGWISEDPSLRLPTVRVPQGRPRPAPEDIVRLAILMAPPRTKAMLMLAAYQGLRCAEIARLHADDLTTSEPRVHGKGGKIRVIPLHSVVAAALPATDGYLFPGQHDGHLSPLWVSKLIGRALPDGWTAHTLRHRFATVAYSAERDLLAVQALLGHSSSETTRRYTAIPCDALSRAVAAAGPKTAA
jgi:integrase